MATLTINEELVQARYVLSTWSTPAIASGDIVVVGVNGAVISTGSSAIHVSDVPELDIVNDGLISGTSQSIYLDGPGGIFTLTNGNTGRIENDGGRLYAAHISGASSTVTNAGQMVGSAASAYPTLIQTSSTSTLVNSGLITDSSTGPKTYAATVAFYAVSTANFTNLSTIQGNGTGGTDTDATVAFIVSTASVTFHNEGRITSPRLAVYSDAWMSEDFRNSGTIEGGVKLSDTVGASFLNSGLIFGDVLMRGGNDTYTAVGEGMVEGEVDGGDGQDELTGGNAADVLRGRAGTDVLRGFGGDDLLYGGDNADSIYAGDGADSAWGGAWGDLIEGRDGADSLRGEGGGDTLLGGLGRDWIYSGDGADEASGGRGDDLVFGGNGGDTLRGDDGGDELFGGLGQDAIYAGNGADTALGGDGDDLVYGGNGHDSLQGGGGADTLGGGAGRDTIAGGAGNDRIDAGSWADVLYGGDGADTLNGGLGADTMTGGAGADVFVLSNAAHSGLGAASDRIADFEQGLDRIDLSALGVSWNGTASFDGSANFARYYTDFGHAHVMIDLDGDRAVDLRLVVEETASLSAVDFIL